MDSDCCLWRVSLQGFGQVSKGGIFKQQGGARSGMSALPTSRKTRTQELGLEREWVLPELLT
jgi:hypothetical protein